MSTRLRQYFLSMCEFMVRLTRFEVSPLAWETSPQELVEDCSKKCDHEMTFPDENSLEWLFVCRKCGHETTDMGLAARMDGVGVG